MHYLLAMQLVAHTLQVHHMHYQAHIAQQAATQPQHPMHKQLPMSIHYNKMLQLQDQLT